MQEPIRCPSREGIAHIAETSGAVYFVIFCWIHGNYTDSCAQFIINRPVKGENELLIFLASGLSMSLGAMTCKGNPWP